MDLYRDLILDHYRNPRNFGHLDKPDVLVEDHNISCGDKIVMEIKGSDKIDDIRFSGEGCAISQASASMLTEKAKTLDKKKILALTVDDITTMLGTPLTPSRIKCALLPLEVLQKAVANV